MGITWGSSSSDHRTSRDTALFLNVPGILEINNGTAGTFRDLKLRNLTATGSIISPPTSPAQITSDQNNYTPTVAGIIRLSSDASRSITGLTFSTAQVDGQQTMIANVGAQNIVLVNESASSTAGNRFHNTTGADITLEPDKQARLWYDATTARWRVSKDN
jgi:hypothetical protein